MIVNSAHDFGFVHIPKCAGSTIRHQLRDHDDMGARFYHRIPLPEIGIINGNHVPLDRLEQYFPEALEQLRAVTSYAIIRAPFDRFVSGVAQHLRTEGVEPGTLSGPELLQATEEIIAGIQNDPDRRIRSNTIFYPQVDFVYLNGEKVINYVWPMDDVDTLIDRIIQVHGLELLRDTKWNPTVTYRIAGLSGALKRANSLTRRWLPRRAYVTLRDLGIRTLTTKGAPTLETELAKSARAHDFVDSYYGDDIALYNEVRAAHAYGTAA